MIKKEILLILLLIGSFNQTTAQTVINDPEILSQVKETPQERVFIHYNSPLLFAGEELLYKIYTVNSDSGELSNLSKIAYVEMIDKNKNLIFRHPIALENGEGRGDFFIPASLPSGNYKIIGYTQWMKNGEKNNFFHDDIAIINPYQNDQEAIIADSDEEIKKTTISSEAKPQKDNVTQRTGPVKIELPEGKVYGKREPVEINIRSASTGNFSISVRKTDSINAPDAFTSKSYLSLFHDQEVNRNRNNLIFLPEIRGSLIKGKIIPAGKEENIPVANQKVALSIPGKYPVLKIVETNEKGIFNIGLNEFPDSTAILQVLGKNKDQFKIELTENKSPDYTSLKFDDFFITSKQKEEILQRSIYNQVQNVYLEVKPDTIIATKNADAFYGNSLQEYYLDDYTRFPTIGETFLEIIKSAWITKNDEGEKVFELRTLNTETDFEIPPMVLVDGILVQDHEKIIDYNVRKIEKISVLRDKYYLGPKAYQGVIAFETFEEDFDQDFSPEYLKKVQLKIPVFKKKYFRQKYYPENNNYDRIPDFRIQLLWEPGLDINSANKEWTFFTSDIPGIYEINLEGFTLDGQPVSLNEFFTVK